MKTLIVYDSNYGNTEEIAKEISSAIGVDTKAMRASQCDTELLVEQELLIVGSPINGWRPTESITNLLRALPDGSLDGVLATSFDTRLRLFFHGDAKKKIADMLTDKGAHILIEPKEFHVKSTEGPLEEDELKNAVAWAKQIVEAANDESKRL